MNIARAWSLLAIEGVRQYGGNTGYDDDPSAIYRYDSDVANHCNVRSGDIVIVRSRNSVLGIATIEEVIAGIGHKARQRCPSCSSVNIKKRITRLPRWRCSSGHEFDQPVEDVVQVTTFEAHYAGTFRKCPPELTLDGLSSAVIRPSDQMSIKELDLARLEPLLLKNSDGATLIKTYADGLGVIEASTTVRSGPPSIIEERRRVLRELALRRGQSHFRDRLIKRYGARCQISRCGFQGLIEAAHVNPYALSGDNSEYNGLLLRSDLHTLFDLGLLAIDPETLFVAVHPNARAAGYEAFDGTILSVNGTEGPSREALHERWSFYQSRLKAVRSAE